MKRAKGSHLQIIIPIVLDAFVSFPFSLVAIEGPMRRPIHWLLRPTLDSALAFRGSMALNFLSPRENSLLDNLVTLANNFGMCLGEILNHKLNNGSTRRNEPIYRHTLLRRSNFRSKLSSRSSLWVWAILNSADVSAIQGSIDSSRLTTSSRN